MKGLHTKFDSKNCIETNFNHKKYIKTKFDLQNCIEIKFDLEKQYKNNV